jgi:hypothetical protein
MTITFIVLTLTQVAKFGGSQLIIGSVLHLQLLADEFTLALTMATFTVSTRILAKKYGEPTLEAYTTK